MGLFGLLGVTRGYWK